MKVAGKRLYFTLSNFKKIEFLENKIHNAAVSLYVPEALKS